MGAGLLAIVAWWTAPRPVQLPEVTGPVTIERVRMIVGQRCITCHSAVPTFAGLSQPPAGVILESPLVLAQHAQRVNQQVVATRIMPLGNITGMTDEERAVVAAWVSSGAKID